MITSHDVADVRIQVDQWRRGGNVAFVPTMGNLHEGHLQLVREARARADRVVVSIFVNPLQFGGDEDFDRYPRTFEADQQKLAAEGVDLLFAPAVEVIYPIPLEQQTRVEVPGLSDIYCGACRPGHFVGVATIVCKLFNMVQPDVAVFGKKDYQQLAVIRRMVRDLAMPIEVVGIDTVREADGLALSSRNQYLSAEQRAMAPVLYRVLRGTAEKAVETVDYKALQLQAAAELDEQGFKTDYVYIVDRHTLAAATPETMDLVILAAARLGQTRLIDNLEVTRHPASS